MASDNNINKNDNNNERIDDHICYTPEDVYNFAKVGDIDNLRIALQIEDNTTNWFRSATVNEPNNYFVALHLAAENDHLECVEILLNSGADVNVKSSSFQETPLFLAARQGHLCIVDLLIERGADMNTISNDKYFYDHYFGTAISTAAYFGNLYVVAMLFYAGAEVNDALKAAIRGGTLDCLNFLLDEGVDVDLEDSDGWTPITESCFCSQTDCVRELILRGADVNCVDTDDEWSPLLMAAKYGNIDICRMLLDNKAEIDDDIDIYNPYMGEDDLRPMILAEIENRRKRAIFDSFIAHYFEYPLYKSKIYKICYPDGNTKVAEPPIGWSRAEIVRNKYYFDELFFYLRLHVAKITTNSKSNKYSYITALATNSDDTSTLMTVLLDRLKMYLKPSAL